LLAKYEEKSLQSQYAKAKTVIVNGYKLMMAKKALFKVENLPILNDCNAMKDKACMSKEHQEAFNKVTDSASGVNADTFPKEYEIQGKEDKSPFKWEEVPYIFVTTDGMTYGVLPDEDIKSFSVVADVNGLKKPNTVKKDLYKFRFSGNGSIFDVSSELENVDVCSIDNMEACKTEEECVALNHLTVGVDSSGNKVCYTINWDKNNSICSNHGRILGSYDTSFYCR